MRLIDNKNNFCNRVHMQLCIKYNSTANLKIQLKNRATTLELVISYIVAEALMTLH